MRQQVLGFLGDELADRDMFLRAMNECWLSHCRQMIMVRSIFLYLDRTYVLQSPAILSIWSVTDGDQTGQAGAGLSGGRGGTCFVDVQISVIVTP